MSNESIARVLENVAHLLAAEKVDPFRARACRRAARAVRMWRTPIAERYANGGIAALMDLPGVGAAIARVMVELLDTGRVSILDRRGHARCERRLATVPGIGPVLAHRVHVGLNVHTLEELRTAANDGRLAGVSGFAARRVRGVAETLAGRLGHWQRQGTTSRPALPVPELLDVDREYRDKAARGALLRIAPHQFNPGRLAWLPVLRTTRGSRQYTALFSNTARAHALGKIGDWVTLYVDDGRGEREATVVTETAGALAGERVVRGREEENRAYHAPIGGASNQAATSRAAG